MKTIYSTIILLLIGTIDVSAQDINVHLNGGAQGKGEIYPTLGAGMEVKASRKRWTVYGDFDYGWKSNTTLDGVLVDRNLYAIQSGVRFYWREAFRGLNFSFFGNYHQEHTSPAEGIAIPNSARLSDLLGFGLGVGYSAKLDNGMVVGFNTGFSGDTDDATFLHLKLQVGYLF